MGCNKQVCVGCTLHIIYMCITFKSRSHTIYCTHVLIHTVHTPDAGPGTVEDSISETDSSEGSDLSSSPEDNDTDTINTPTLR